MSETRDTPFSEALPAKTAIWPEGSIEGGVLIGRRGHLFLVGGAHAVLKYSSGEIEVPSHCYLNFGNNIIQRASWSSARGARYVHVIFPDKQSVLTDDYTLPPPICLGDKYLANAGASSADLLYLKDALRRESEGSFLRTDTHLSDAGLARAAVAITSRFSDVLAAALEDRLRRAHKTTREHCGDLGSKLQPAVSMPEEFLISDWPVHAYSNGLPRNTGLVDIWVSPTAENTDRLLIFGDSFGRGLARMMSCVFSEVLFLRTQFFHVDIVDQVRPTHIITQNVERYLTFIEPDRNRPSFHMYPFFGPSEGATPSKDFAEAFSAMLSYPRPPYQKFVAKIRADYKPDKG